jgi:hypothetical protein
MKEVSSMATTLTIELPDTTLAQLQRRAAARGSTPEALAAAYLTQLLPDVSADELHQWIGAFESNVPDAAERHHEYLGQALAEKLQGGPGK